MSRAMAAAVASADPAAPPLSQPAPERLVSLDAFRGLAVAGMILVNNPGSWSHVYPPLAHAKWHGWTPTDLVFPFFLFAVGASLTLSRRTTLRAALRRTAIVSGLGLLLAAYPAFDPATVRIPGVLQRIALCYLATWLVARWLSPRAQAAVAALLLVGYWLLLTRVGAPGGPPSLEPGQDLGAWLDRVVFGTAHLWRQSRTWDPEGLLSTIPAVATTVFGLLAGEWLRARRVAAERASGLLAAGLALAALGLLWGRAFPINKNLWTSSYAVFTAGLAAVTLGLFYAAADVRGWRRAAEPLVVYGRNAILVFVASGLVAKTLYLVKVTTADGRRVALHTAIHESVFASLLPPDPASLAFALANVFLWYVVLLALHRRGVYLKA